MAVARRRAIVKRAGGPLWPSAHRPPPSRLPIRCSAVKGSVAGVGGPTTPAVTRREGIVRGCDEGEFRVRSGLGHRRVESEIGWLFSLQPQPHPPTASLFLQLPGTVHPETGRPSRGQHLPTASLGRPDRDQSQDGAGSPCIYVDRWADGALQNLSERARSKG